jgi:hypothetical protein
MRIAELSLANLMTLTEYEFKPGQLTEISGGNRAGKSTVLRAILSLLQGAADVRMVQNGQGSGQVQIIFDEGSQATLRMDADADRRLVVRGPGGKVLPGGKPQAFLRGLIDRLVNPLELLREDLKPEDRLRWVLEALPASTTAERLREVCGFGELRDYQVAPAEHALLAIDRVYSRLYSERGAINSERDEKRKAADEMSRALPPGAEEMPDYAAKVERLAGELARLNAQESTNTERAEGLLREEIQAAEAEYSSQRAGIIGEANRKIAELKLLAERDVAAARQAADQRIGEARILKGQAVATAAETIAESLRACSVDLEIARAKLSESERIKNLLALVDAARRRAATLDSDSAVRTKALRNLDRLKVDLLAQMPLEGIDVRGGELNKGGVAWPLLNTEQQIDLAVDLAALRAGKLGLLLVDGLERLDADRQDLFWRKASTTGLQYIASCVTKGPLTVKRLTVTGEAIQRELIA